MTWIIRFERHNKMEWNTASCKRFNAKMACNTFIFKWMKIMQKS